MRKCIGSAKFGIEAHEAPVEDFPSQPSQKDGLGRMCRLHWNEYALALRKAALARKAAAKGEAKKATKKGATKGKTKSAVGPRGRETVAEVEAAEVEAEPVAG